MSLYIIDHNLLVRTSFSCKFSVALSNIYHDERELYFNIHKKKADYYHLSTHTQIHTQMKKGKDRKTARIWKNKKKRKDILTTQNHSNYFYHVFATMPIRLLEFKFILFSVNCQLSIESST